MIAPEVPDPTKIVSAGAEVGKAVGQGVVSVGVDIAEGLRSIAFATVEGGRQTVDQAVKNLLDLVRPDIDSGRTTVDNVRRDIDQSLSTIRTQFDQAIGQEVVTKFKRQVERFIK